MTAAPDPPAGPRTVLAAATVVAGTAAGVGWLYLLRDTGALRAGPALHDALALDRLAGRDAQPLLRVIAAFVPAGLFVGLALRALTRLGRTARALLAGVPAYVLLGVIGTASDAVTRSAPAARYVGAQPMRAAVLVPALVLALCAYAMPGGGPRTRSPTALVRRRMPGAKRTPTPTQDAG
jgi:hypothetical protein